MIGGAYREFPNVVANQIDPETGRPRDPTKEFELPADAWPVDATVEAVIHSHVAPGDLLHRVDPRAPSAADIAGQQATAVPWGILWTDGERATEPLWFGDHLLAEPLFADGAHRQKPFVHGVWDCYSLVRRWFHQECGVTLVDAPRSPAFWETEGDLFGTHLTAFGFARVERADLREGDVALIRTMRALAFPHHCGVVLPGRQLLHHPLGRLSLVEPFGRWEAHVLYGARYVG